MWLTSGWRCSCVMEEGAVAYWDSIVNSPSESLTLCWRYEAIIMLLLFIISCRSSSDALASIDVYHLAWMTIRPPSPQPTCKKRRSGLTNTVKTGKSLLT